MMPGMIALNSSVHSCTLWRYYGDAFVCRHVMNAASVEKAGERCKVPGKALAAKNAFHGFSYVKPEPDVSHF